MQGNELRGEITAAQVFIESGGYIGKNMGGQLMLVDHFGLAVVTCSALIIRL
ncbi:MAG: hypothetical protein NTV37_09100 [Proteobacteria bacterium]|nr:hypothetical protein [Pseudomonadota bacterium]